MCKKITTITISCLIVFSIQIMAQNNVNDSLKKSYFIGSSLFVLGNLIPQNRPDFIQINFGYRVNKKQVISCELKTWKYAWPLGIPYGKLFEAPEFEFPGYIREVGLSLAYQHYWWKGLYTELNVMGAYQWFINTNNLKIGNGFHIFNTYRIGYHIAFCNNKFFIQPSVAITHRPFQTTMPIEFKEQNDKFSKFLFGEPGLHFGFNF